MKIAHKLDDGFVIQELSEAPSFPHLLITEEIQAEYEALQNPKLKDDLSGFEEGIIEIKVPETISRMGLKIQLRIRNIDISEVEKTIRELPDWMMSPLEKDLAVIKFNDAAYYDRYNGDYNLVATMMGLSQTDLDEIHINGNKI